MNNKMDWMNELPENEGGKYEKDTSTRFLDKKLHFVIIMAVIVAIDFIIAIFNSAVRRYDAVYQFEPWLLLIIDLGYLVYSQFVSFRQNGAKIGSGIYLALSAVFTVITIVLAFTDGGAVTMSILAAVVLIFVWLAKVLIVFWELVVLPKYYWNNRQYSLKLLTSWVGVGVCVLFLLFNAVFGFMGQNIAVPDKEATLSFSEDANGDFVVVGTVDKGNIINVPQSFNGRKVVGIEAAVLNDTAIKLLTTENEDFRIYNVDELTKINPDLRVEVSKSALNDTREHLFYQLRSHAYNYVGEKLLNIVAPNDLAADETYYHFIYKGETPKELIYIPTVFAKKSDFDATAVYSQMGGYFAHTGINSQDDLEWCFNNNGGYILDEANLAVEENAVRVPFSKINYFESLDGNDTKWSTPVESQYIATANLKPYFDDLPTRNGFNVRWSADGVNMLDSDYFEHYFAARCGLRVYFKPFWEVKVPTITKSASNKTITYGENTVVEVQADSVLPCTYSLYGGLEMITSQETGEFALNGYNPTQNGRYEIRITASDPEITSLTSDAAVSEFDFVINKKLMHVSWTLPDGEVYDNTAKTISCDYDENDVVSSDDVILLQLSRTTVVHADNYDVSVTLDGYCSLLYRLNEQANASFSVLPKPVTLQWETLSEETLVYTKTEKSVSAQVTNLFSGDSCDVTVEITSENKVGAGEVEYSATRLTNTDYTLESGEGVSNVYVITPLVINFDWQLPEDLVYDAGEKIATVVLYNVIGGDECTINTEHDGDNVSAGVVNYSAIGLLGADRANYELPEVGLVATFEIDKRLASLRWDELTDEDLIYSGAEKRVDAAVENLYGEDTCSVEVEIISDNKFRVGEVVYLAVSLGNDNYYLAQESGWTISYYITPLSVSVSWQVPTEEELVYDKTEKTAVAVIDNLVFGDDCDIETDHTPNVLVGKVEYFCLRLYGDDSYNYDLPEGISTDFDITQRTVVIEWTTPDESELEYDGTEKATTYVLSNLMDGDECLPLVGNTEDLTSAGIIVYSLNDLYGENYFNYKLPEERSISYEIRKRTVTLEWSTPTGAVYDKTEKEAQATFLNKLEDDDCSFVIEHNDNVSAGKVVYTVVGLDGVESGNYQLPETDDISASFVIAQKEATLSWVELTEGEREYRGSVLDVVANVNNLEDGDECTVELEITSDNSIDVGDVDYRAVGLLNGNYKLTDESDLERSYTILRRLIDFEWDVPTGENAIYDATAKVAVPRFNNLVLGDDCVINTTNTPNVEAGDVDYAITGISGEKSGNYYLPTSNLTTSFKIEQRTAVIDWTVLSADELIYDKRPKNVAATVTNIQGQDACTPTVVRTSQNEYDAGAVSYEVTGLSNSNYKITADSNAGKTYTISQLEVVLEWTLPNNAVYDGTEKAAAIQFKNLIDGDDCALAIEHGDVVNAGDVEYVITGLTGAQSGNYKLPLLGRRRSYVIDKRVVTFAWTLPTELIYDGTAKTATVSLTNIVDDDVCTPTVTNTDNTNAGRVTYTLTALDGLNKDNYKLPLTGLTAQFTILQREAQLSWTVPAALIYDGNPKTATVTMTNKVTGDDCTVQVSHGDNVNAGSVVYTATELTGSQSGNYSLPVSKSTQFTIAPLTVSINWQLPTSAVYDGSPKTATATVGNKITGDDCILVLKHTDNVNAGTASVEAVGLSGNQKGNYSLTSAADKEKTFAIGKRAVQLQWTELSAAQLVYDGNEKAVVATVSNKVSGDNCTVTVEITSDNRAKAGAVVYKAVSMKNGDNYSLPTGTAAERSYEITKRVIQLSWTNPTDAVYNGNAKTAAVNITNLVGSDDCTLTVEHVNNVNAGTATAEVTSLNGSDKANYALPSNVKHMFAITQRPVTIEWTLPNTTYDGSNKTATPTLKNVVAGDAGKIEINVVHSADIKNVGKVIFEVKTLTGEKGANYSLPNNEKDRTTSFTIQALAVNISWSTPKNAVYDGQPKAATATITNKVTGDDVEVLIGYNNNNVNAGTVTCRAIGLKGNQKDNYSLTSASTASFEIAKADRVATVSMQNWTYGESAKNPTVNQTAGDSATITYTYAQRGSENFSSTVPTAAGRYTVKATVAASNDYKAISVTGEFEILAKAVTIKWTLSDDDVYDGTEKAVTAEVQGLVGNDSCGVSIGIVSVNTCEAGDVTYRATALGNPNYTIGSTSNAEYTITIKKATRSGITLNMESWTEGGVQKTPSVTGYSGQVKYEYAQDGSSVYSETAPTTAGVYTVRMTIAADKNYNAYVITKSYTIYAQQVGE